jgi:uncharacterized protein with FMN-binding domain
MAIKKLIPYILVFLASFIITPIIVTGIIKKANEQAREYGENFKPTTSNLPDGTYQGKYKAFGLITMSDVEFTVQNGVIETIEFKKMFHSPGSPYKENIENQIKESRKLEVNAISGATRTSNFAKAAIKDAINKEQDSTEK